MRAHLHYTSVAYVIDMWGLCTVEIATKGNTDGINPIYGLDCSPCYAELRPDFFHVVAPLIRREPAFGSREEVIGSVWQSGSIGRYVDFAEFAGGPRVAPADPAGGVIRAQGAWVSGARRRPKPGFVIEYPFEGDPG